MNTKYLFRVYKFDDKGNIKSPFMSHDGQFNRTEVAEGLHPDVGNIYGAMWHNDKLYIPSDKHYGFSTFGKIDPKYSIFPSDTATDFSDDRVLDAIQANLLDNIPLTFKNKTQYKKYYQDGETNDYEFLTNPMTSPWLVTKALTGTPAKSYSLKPEYFDFESDEVWDDLVWDIDAYDLHKLKFPGSNTPDEGDKIVLVTTPEDKILTIDDVIKKGLTTQRDFPSEIVSSEITPIKEITNYPEAVKKYTTLRDRGAKGPEAFGESFKLEPHMIASDETLKNIYSDIRNLYKNCYMKDHITNAVLGVGQ
jgi:hypothetical protein